MEFYKDKRVMECYKAQLVMELYTRLSVLWNVMQASACYGLLDKAPSVVKCYTVRSTLRIFVIVC